MKELSTIELKADNKLQNQEVKNTSKYRQVKKKCNQIHRLPNSSSSSTINFSQLDKCAGKHLKGPCQIGDAQTIH